MNTVISKTTIPASFGEHKRNIPAGARILSAHMRGIISGGQLEEEITIWFLHYRQPEVSIRFVLVHAETNFDSTSLRHIASLNSDRGTCFHLFSVGHP